MLKMKVISNEANYLSFVKFCFELKIANITYFVIECNRLYSLKKDHYICDSSTNACIMTSS